MGLEIFQDVRARGARWRVTDIRAFTDCRLVALASTDAASHARSCQLLAPFDDIDPIVTADRPRRVGLRRWRRACRALLAADAPPGSLRCAARAHIDLLPHQLEPALAVLRGEGSRILLADDVGLGKTIQAGLILVELMERRAAERALILTPAGLRDQWVDELQIRFDVRGGRADSRSLAERAAALPFGQNPWARIPIAVASLDYVKRHEVLPAVTACRWDVLIVDEAHAAVGDSDRSAAVRAIACRAAHVVLLTATPHSGDDKAFATLCGFGASGDDPLVVFRRTRQKIRGELTRRVHTLRVRPSALERRMFGALNRYRRALLAENGALALPMSVLDKRALSSPWSLAQSVQRRLQTLAGVPLEGDGHQLPLPLADVEGELDAEDAPPPWPEELALSDTAAERRLLTEIADSARAAAGSESKVDVVRRLLRRARESAVIFTEYRDTAEHVRAMLGAPLILHGGLSRAARSAVLDAFARDRRAVLVATDAAGQGLNLHRACRLVVNLELPWNPMRLEQRIGRVDRIGQRRRVHAVHLIAAGTHEERIFERLRARIASAREAIDAPDPIQSHVTGPTRSADNARLVTPSLERDARLEAARAAHARVFTRDGDHDALGCLESSKWWVARARRARLRRGLAGQTLFIFRFSTMNMAGRMMASRLVPVAVGARAAQVDTALLTPMLDDWTALAAASEDAFWRRRLARLQSIAASEATADDSLFQPALFDRRAEQVRDDQHSTRAQLRESRVRAIEDGALQSTIRRHACELLLVLLP